MLFKIFTRLFILFFWVSLPLWGTITYQTSKGDTTYYALFSLVNRQWGKSITVTFDRAEFQGEVDHNFTVKRFRFIMEKQKTDYWVSRRGNSIRIEGMFNGSKIDKTQQLDPLPWCQFFEYNFEEFLNSEKKKFHYWAFAGTQVEMYRMEAVKLGIENIQVDGEEVEALHVRAYPEGFFSAFWHCDFWYRKSDNAFVRYEATEGLGEPLTVIQLVDAE